MDPEELNSRRIAFILNPQAGAGKGGQILQDLNTILPEKLGADQYKIFITSRQGEGIELAQQALTEKFNWLVSVGGDGTHNEVINGILKFQTSNAEFQEKVVMALLPVGTGGDFQRSLGTASLSPNQSFHLIINPNAYGAIPQLMDVGLVKCSYHPDASVNPTQANGSTSAPEALDVHRYFLNISSCGISAEVCNGANRGSKVLGGFATFMYQTCKQSLLWNNKPLRWCIDDAEEFADKQVYQLVVANGKYFGGGMMVAPDADPTDNQFDVVVFKEIGVLDVDILLKIYSGSHKGERKVQFQRGRKVFAEVHDAKHDVLIEADGEIVGKLPACWEIVPSQVWVLFPTSGTSLTEQLSNEL